MKMLNRAKFVTETINRTIFFPASMERNQEVTGADFAAKIIKQIRSDHNSKSPPARHHHSLVSYRGDLYLFGGLGADEIPLSDLWQFSTASEKWNQLHTKGTPKARHSHQAVVYNQKMFVFGGVCQNKTAASNELYCLDFDKNIWELVGELEVRRSGHFMVFYEGSFILFGGIDQRRRAMNSLHVIGSTGLLRSLSQYTSKIIPRKYAASAMLGSCMYIYGGEADTTLGDFYRVRVNPSLTSAEVEQLTVPSMIPALKGATLSVSPINNTHLILFGGSLTSSNSSLTSSPNTRVFTFSTVTEEWHEAVEFVDSLFPTSRSYHQTTYTDDGRMYVFGGLNNETNTELNDLWMFGDAIFRDDILPNELWTMIFEFLEGEELAAVSVTSKTFTELVKSDEKLVKILSNWIAFSNMKIPKIDDNIYLMVVGDQGVGKSASVVQCVMGIFVEQYDPTIEDNYRMYQEINKKRYFLELMDTANFLDDGQSTVTHIRTSFMQQTHGVYAIYDITRPQTLTNLEKHLERIKQTKGHKFPVIVVGNKTDLDTRRKVSQQEGQDFAKKHGALWTETSAKQTDQVKNAFHTILSYMVEIELKNRQKAEENEGRSSSKKNKKTKTKDKDKDKCSVM